MHRSRLLHGGDYNPDQWLHEPATLEQDLRLMRQAGVNAVSVGIFAWASLEPLAGRFQFDWLDRVMDGLAAHGVGAILATPSGSKPAWLSQQYPEVCRCESNGHRQHHAGRHNHCMTSPVYREKVAIVNGKLAERYASHPALLLWHISNEYGGECHCPLCKDAFRQWLQRRYGSLDALNQAWWARFWSHTFTDWNQIDYIDSSMPGMVLDWRRFVTDQSVDFCRQEIAALRVFSPDTPVTTNMMGTYEGLNYWKFAEHLDVVSWDSYPAWHSDPNGECTLACQTAFVHDIYRAMKPDRPWLLMESAPSNVNWQSIPRPKRPGMHRLASLQAVAHGSDSVLYFQWRAGRGGCEKFHGAVVDHSGRDDTRVFREVAALGRELADLHEVAGSTTKAEVAVIYDWENAWGIELMAGPRNVDKDYLPTCVAHYQPLWRRGIATAVIDSTADFSSYRLILAPMLYMLRPGVAERLVDFVHRGGTLVTTYLAGWVDESDLCFRGGAPGPLRELLGVRVETTDVLHVHNPQTVVPVAGNALGLQREYPVRHFCDIVHPEGADVLATYGNDFYAGSAALTLNRFGKGQACYVASRNEEPFTDDLIGALIQSAGVRSDLPCPPPSGVSVQRRGDWLFLLNFNAAPASVDIGNGDPAVDLAPYGTAVCKQASSGGTNGAERV